MQVLGVRVRRAVFLNFIFDVLIVVQGPGPVCNGELLNILGKPHHAPTLPVAHGYRHAARELQTLSPLCARRSRRWYLRDSSRHSNSAHREEGGEEATRQAAAG